MNLVRSTLRKIFYFTSDSIMKFFNSFIGPNFRLIVTDLSDKYMFNEVWCFLSHVENRCPLQRVGGENDGGYFCPTDLSTITHVFSPGYGGVKSFEDAMTEQSKHVYICDPSYSSIENLLPGQSFDSIELYSETNKDRHRYSLQDWVGTKIQDSNNQLLLQMDIEGGEWKILESISTQFLQRFKICIIEFHNLDRLLFDRGFLALSSRVVGVLGETFVNVFSKGNNAGGHFYFDHKKFPKVVEVTLVNASCIDLFSDKSRETIDYDMFKNDPTRPSLDLPFPKTRSGCGKCN